MDNFSMYGLDETKLLDGVYAQATWPNLRNDPDPNATGIVWYSQYASILRYVLKQDQTTVGVAQRVYLLQMTSDNSFPASIITFRNAANSSQFTVAVNTAGEIVILSGHNPGAIIAKTDKTVLTANAWYHVEVKHDSVAGTIEVRVEGVPVLSVDGQIHGATRQIVWYAAYSQIIYPGTYHKDVVIWNGSGTRNNDWMGSVVVYSLVPDSDVSLGWTPSTGTVGWSLIDEGTPNDEDYISAAYPPPAPSTFGLLNSLPPDITSVRGLQTWVRASKLDGGDGNLQTSLISDGTEVLGEDRPITAAFTYWRDTFETDPATGAAWHPSAMPPQLKVNRTL